MQTYGTTMRYHCPLDCGWHHDAPQPDAIHRVRVLHEKRDSDAGTGAYCEVCSNHGDTNWPCATIRALGPEQ